LDEVEFEQFGVDMYLLLLKQVGAVYQNVEPNSPQNCFLVASFDPFMKVCNLNRL